ncbi:hypothetical protein EPN90_02275 [Patescibacteria group bacterium]|nr:MAG: hypothetical protein EPN90_02275 [Patescibacteria group bacterium]
MLEIGSLEIQSRYMARIIPAGDGYYHVYNRGVLKQPIFLEEEDYFKFLHDLQRFNAIKIGSREIGSRKPLVSILAWCLMPNHFHLFLQQRQEEGVSLFMHRLGVGFTMFMNKKYKRSGHLFQSKYQAKLISGDAQFFHISRYVHLNPLDLIEPEWEEHGVREPRKAEKFIEEYCWSSYADWLGNERFPSIIDELAVRDIRAGTGDYRKFVRDWISRDPISGADVIG